MNYLSWKEQQRSFEQLGAIGFANYNLTGVGDPEQVPGGTITPSIFPILGIQPLRGRAFQEGDDGPGSPNVAMISEGLWRRRFGADTAAIGRAISINGVSYTLVGIAPPSLTLLAAGDLWTPLIINPPAEARLNHVIYVVGRLKPGIALSQAQAEMDAVSIARGTTVSRGQEIGASNS